MIISCRRIARTLCIVTALTVLFDVVRVNFDAAACYVSVSVFCVLLFVRCLIINVYSDMKLC